METHHRPRNVDWKRAAAILYGDWGTSKAYVIGLAFVAAGYGSLPIILAIGLLTAVVGYNYTVVCRHFPDGGGVYSAARGQSRLLACLGALLLAANFMVTAALSGWAAVSYLGVPEAQIPIATALLIAVVGALNFFGPKHSGSVSIWLALPAVAVVVLILLFAAPHFTLRYAEPPPGGPREIWVAFVGVILALSGVEAVANLTGVMKLDPGATPDKPHVGKTATKSILPVAVEVVLGTVLLGWAMLSMPSPEFREALVHRQEDMLRFLGQHYAGLSLGPVAGQIFGLAVGVIFGLLLISAVNTAVVALIGVQFMMAQDGEMPRGLAKLNRHGVPLIPLAVAVVIPIAVLFLTRDFKALAGLYAIGVVGAITVNLGSCTFNGKLALRWYERLVMGLTFLVLFAVELTLAKTKPDALFFAVCVVGIGLGLRAYSHRVSGLKTLTVSREMAEMVSPETLDLLKPALREGMRILVAARGVTPVLRYALEEAELRGASLYVLYVKEVSVFMSGAPTARGKARWQDDPQASAIMSVMTQLGKERGVEVVPVYAVADEPASTIVDVAATLGVDMLMLGASHRQAVERLLKGNLASRVAADLPEEIQLIITA